MKNLGILIALGAILLAVKRQRPVLAGHSVKEEFWRPCNCEYDKAVQALKFVTTFHNPDAVFRELKSDVLGY